MTLSLFEATGGDLPALPVLAVIPPGPAAPFWPVLLAVPATVGALLGRYVAQRHLEARARGEYVSSTDAALTVVAAAALAGATSALATWVAGGPLGIFGVVGGNWWLAGVLVFAWSGLLGLVTSQLLLWREHRLAAAEAARASAAAEESATETAAAENPDDDEPVAEADATPLDEAKALEAGPATPTADVLEAEIVEDGPEGQQDPADAGTEGEDPAERVDPADDERVDVADAELEDAADEPGGSGVTEQDAGAPPERNGDLPEGAAPPKG